MSYIAINTWLETHSYWTPHPAYPLRDWKYEVANNDTRRGYWNWCRRKQEEKENE